MTVSSVIWVDGESTSNLSLPDRGFDFGDGLFETLLIEDGRPRYPDLHWQRLRRGLRVLGFPDCLDDASAQLQGALADSRLAGWPRTALRITVSRGRGPRGYEPPLDTRVRIVISAVQLPELCGGTPPPAVLAKAETRWGIQPQLAGIKHCNRLEQVLAAAEKQRAGADEALMLGQGGQLVSVTAGNLFLRQGHRLYTPLLDECGIEGTRRRLLIERWAPAIGCAVHESRLGWSDLAAASEVFYTNTLWGLRPVASLGDLRWDSREACSALYSKYREEVP